MSAQVGNGIILGFDDSTIGFFAWSLCFGTSFRWVGDRRLAHDNCPRLLPHGSSSFLVGIDWLFTLNTLLAVPVSLYQYSGNISWKNLQPTLKPSGEVYSL